MEKYISQLLEDLYQAAKNPTEPPDYSLLYNNYPKIEGKMDYIITTWEYTPEEKASDIFGITDDVFPSIEMITEEQADQVNKAILNLWGAYHIYTNIPSEAPPKIVYKELVRCWKEDKFKLLPKDIGSEVCFCRLDPEMCCWGIHCICKDNDS